MGEDKRNALLQGMLKCSSVVMTTNSSGNIVLNGTTYNPTQINSVEIGTVRKHDGIWMMFIILGFPGLLLAVIHPIVWVLGTIAALVVAANLSSETDWALFFDMSSGKVAAFISPDKSKVKAVHRDIVNVLR